MKRVGNLYEKICSMDNLKLAHKNARKGKAWYGEVKMVDENPEFYLKQIQDMFLEHRYKTSEYEVFTKKEGNKIRTIYKLPYFPDRIAQWAIIQVIEPYLLRTFTKDTYSSIPNMGIHKALGKLKKVMHNDPIGTKYCLKLDVRHFYQNIDHRILKNLFRRIFKDEELLGLIFGIIDTINAADVEELELFYKENINYETGIPIGNYLSQYCGNLYLSELDHLIKEKFGVKYYFRYMDDLCIFSDNKEKLHGLKTTIESYLKAERHLILKPSYQVFPTAARGVDFVGYRVFKDYILLRKSICKSFKQKMKTIRRAAKLTYSQKCSINSYLGWLSFCDSCRLLSKYLPQSG